MSLPQSGLNVDYLFYLIPIQILYMYGYKRPIMSTVRVVSCENIDVL